MGELVLFIFLSSYYKPASPPSPGQNILLYLEGGGGCFDKKTCTHRCTVASPQLCTQDEALVKNFTGSVWSEDEEENPGMHNNYKVYVPYCTSDLYSGRKDADDMSAGYAFHGKYVVEAVVEDLLSNTLSDIDLSQFVLMGMSAGMVEQRYFTLKQTFRSFWSWKQLRRCGKTSAREKARS